MNCKHCGKTAVAGRFCDAECHHGYYTQIGQGFFDDNPGYISNRDTFWLMLSQPKRPSSLLLVAALRDAEENTRNRVLTWLLDRTAPVQRVFGKSHEEFVFYLFRGAVVLRAVALMQQIREMGSLKSDDPRMTDLLKTMIATGNAASAELLMGPLRDYNEELKQACEKNRVEMVKLLLKEGRANPAYHKSICLIRAADRGATEIVRLLIIDNRAKVSDRNYAALDSAISNYHRETVRVLLDADSRLPWEKVERMISSYVKANHLTHGKNGHWSSGKEINDYERGEGPLLLLPEED